LVGRWDPEAALHQLAQALLRGLHPGTGETLYLIIDDSKTATRGQAMDAVAKMQAPTTDAYIWGHPYVCGTLLFRQHVIPWGIRLDVKPEAGAAVGAPFQKTTPLAAHLSRTFNAPAGVRGVVLCDAYDLCPTVVKACRDQRCHFASPLKSHRRLFKPGWQLKAGRYGRNQFRRRGTDTLVLTTPHGSARYRVVDAGWLGVSKRGALHVVFSRKGTANKSLGLVTDDPQLSAADIIRTYDKRWTIAPWVKDTKPLLGLGQDQNRSYGAAVTHLHRVCFAYALLPHLRIARTGAQGHQTRAKAAPVSTAAAQDQLRSLLWEDLLASLKEERHGQPVLEELARLRVA
jgi:hypothetical protein